MSSALVLPEQAELIGWQRPRHLWVPPAATSAGPEVVELAQGAGLDLDPWQGFILDGALGETATGYWVCFEVVELVPRQNGKGGVIEARELGGLFLFNEELILHSAHEFKTAQEAFRRIRFLIENTPDLDKRVLRISTSHGDEGIELKPLPTIVAGASAKFTRAGKAPRLRFVARTGGSGRGFSGDCVILDEAFNLPSQVITALMPTLSARRNPQLWYASSPVNQEEHPHGHVLAKLRKRGHAGELDLRKGDPSLAYYEWCADEARYGASPQSAIECAADPLEWASANPGMGIRITELHISREHRSMEAKGFAVERLGIGDWPEVDGQEQVIPEARWEACADPASEIDGRVVVALDASPNRIHGAISVAGTNYDGLPHGEMVAPATPKQGIGWMLSRLIDLCLKWHPRVIILDPTSAAGALIPDIEKELGPEGKLAGLDIELEQVCGREMAQACGYVYDLVVGDPDEPMGPRRCVHTDQTPLNAALAGAKKRSIGDAWGWDRKDTTVNIAPLVSWTLALHGLAKHANDDEGPPTLWI